ncbi:hypothetical protein [Thermococcus sibiricus]|uniref:Uncharacterized protein n=1 Tax=Thermococcus sibiricus (strain DSM 12597 / MM 739) TaxID=604354 RepID=C6A1X7_THESM|nr:hypothetical protein [Thermococcus sibiricus]ACS89622.1 hypothetical protein TSIB_0557 [Thermococcus sibiricus MM 739]
MRRPTLVKNLIELEEMNAQIRRTSRGLEEIVPSLLTEEGIARMFKKDKDQIIIDYKKGLISRKEALQQLKELEDIAEDLKKYVFEARELLEKLEIETQKMIIKLREFNEFPRVGVPIEYVKERIKEDLRKAGDELPKKEFGVLDVPEFQRDEYEDALDAIKEFLEEYYSGVIVAQPRLKESIIEFLHRNGVRFDVKEVASRIVFTVEGTR